MPRSGNGNAIHLELIPESRRRILRLLKRQGPLPVEEIADHLSVTVSGARQHLSSLERQGVVGHRRIRRGPGRPRHLYELTERGDALFPQRYADLLNELLGYVREADPSLVERVFSRRAQRRADRARRRMQGATLEDRLADVVSFLEDEGCYPQLEILDDGRFRVVIRNCPVQAVGEECAPACSSEVALLGKLLPGAEVRRTSHVLNGQPYCAYEIRAPETEPRTGAGVEE